MSSSKTTALDRIKNNLKKKMPPIINPVGTRTLPKSIRNSETIVTVKKGNTGLDTGLIERDIAEGIIGKGDVVKGVTKDEFMDYLQTLDFGEHIPEYYDCEDRAFWGMAHARFKYPGCLIGVAGGYAEYVKSKDKRHAVNIFWYNGPDGLESVLWDPIENEKTKKSKGELKGGKSGFHDIKIVISFPTNLKKSSLKRFGGIFKLDTKRLIYETKPEKEDGPGVLEYLEKELYNKGKFKCREKHDTSDFGAFKERWTDEDQALWAFAHVRRYYPGCSVGVAIGRPKSGGSSAVLAIWPKRGGPRYWDPKTKKEAVSFDPKVVFV